MAVVTVAMEDEVARTCCSPPQQPSTRARMGWWVRGAQSGAEGGMQKC